MGKPNLIHYKKHIVTEVNAIMKLLEEKIKQDGNAVNEHILKVDSFINHQVDPALMQEMGKEIAEHFKAKGITKVATIESSGISPAIMAALALGA